MFKFIIGSAAVVYVIINGKPLLQEGLWWVSETLNLGGVIII